MLEYAEILRQSKLNKERREVTHHQRVCVSVTLHQDTNGKKYPQLIYWKNGKVYKVDRVRDVYLNDSPSGNGKMKLYGVEINGHFTDLVEDGDKWYVYEK